MGTVTIKDTGSTDAYSPFKAKVKKPAGVHDLYLCFGDVQGDIHLDWWQFTR